MDRIELPVLGRAAEVRELTGEDERSVYGTDTRAAADLLERTVSGVAPRDLCAADRDRLLAAHYCSLFGDRVENTVHCASCGSLFDLNFSVSDLVKRIGGGAGKRRPDGTFETEHGTVFRLPAAEMELAAECPGELLQACLVSRGGDTDEEIEAAMEAAAPLVDCDLDAQCPECGRTQQLRFNIQRYLLESVLRDRRRLFSEIHVLASAYGWSMTELLSLRRTERRMLVDILDQERRRAARVLA